jgi:hypothetical protein
MPNKHNADRRHHIPKMKRAVTNWAEYEAGLRGRGSLTMWITDEAIAAWDAPRRSTPGGQAHYSDSAIATLPDAAHGVQAGAAPGRRAHEIRR